jgi:hypothetical protein
MTHSQHTVAATFFSVLLAATSLTPCAAADAPPRALKSAAPADASKWGAHLDLEGKWGNRRALGDIGLFAPLWQSATSLFFTDIRGRLDDQNSREGNFGLGLRHMLPGGWNAGIYGYYDARRTGSDNFFQQATLGAELLSADFDLRVNGYLPFGKREYQTGGGAGGAPFAQLTGGTLQIVTPGGQLVERALRGVDAEIGWRLPVFPVESLAQIRAYAGGFWFDGEGLLRDIAGPRGRIEMSFEQPSGPWAGSRLTLGAEVQHDEVRGTNAFAVARLRIPLQPAERSARRLTPQEQRMTERVVRDVDVVTGQVQKGSGTQTVEAAVNVYNNTTVTDVVQVDAGDGQAALQNEIDTRPVGSIVILNGGINGVANAVTFNNGAAGKTLLGGGAQLPVEGAVSGTQVVFTAPGAAGSLNGTPGGGSGLVNFAGTTNSVVGGLTLANTANSGYGIYSVLSAGVTAFGNTITTSGTSSFGVYVHQDSDTNRLIGNNITTAATSAYGVLIQGNTGSSVIGNTITTAAAHGINFMTATNGSATGNIVAASDGSGIAFLSGSNGGVVSGNFIQTTGSGAGLFADASTGLTVAGNTFGPSIAFEPIHASNAASFVTAASTCNIDNSAAAQRCNGDGTASGTVSFTTAPNCVYP